LLRLAHWDTVHVMPDAIGSLLERLVCRRTLAAGTAMAFLVTSTPVSAAEADAQIGFFDTARERGFGEATTPLRVMMTEAGVPRGRTESFCVVGYRFANGSRLAYVHWARQQKLILWEGGVDPVTRANSLARSRRSLDLRSDVVADETAINGSTYLVTRTWVQRTIAACAKHGRVYRVMRPIGRR
jgi:hypothetical protein